MIKEKLGNIISFQRGYDLTHSQMHGGDVPVVGSSEIIGWHDVSKSKSPTLLIGRSGTVGRPQYYNSNVWPHNTTLFVTDYHGNNPKYCYYLLQGMNLEDYANSSGVPTLNRNFIEPLIVEYHKREEQDKVVNILSSIDDKISTNNKIIRVSKKLTREIYDYWFLQFDFPDENGRPYKSSGGEMVYNETLKREIPKGWDACGILDVVDWIGGAQPPKSTFIYEKRVGYVRFIQNRDYADDSYMTWIPESRNNKICTRYDIMMDKYGDAGRVRFGLAGAYNVALAKINAKNQIMREYVRSFLSSNSIYRYLYNACMASTRASLNEEILGNLNIIIPGSNTLSMYQDITEQHIQHILTLNDENRKLIALRDWLLPMLMNGQVTII